MRTARLADLALTPHLDQNQSHPCNHGKKRPHHVGLLHWLKRSTEGKACAGIQAGLWHPANSFTARHLETYGRAASVGGDRICTATLSSACSFVSGGTAWQRLPGPRPLRDRAQSSPQIQARHFP